MRRRVAVLVCLISLLVVGEARAASIPGLMPELLTPRLLTEVGVPPPPPIPFRSGFSLHSHGYEVKVFTFGSAVMLEVAKGGHRHLAATTYMARGVAVPERLQATFGGLGKVSMRFRPQPREGASSICRFGERLTRRPGTYVGNLSFKGEGGYISLALHRAKGSIVALAGRCRIRHFTPKQIEKAIETRFEPVAGALASSRDGVATTTFVGLAEKRRTAFYATHKETHGKLAIFRFALVGGLGGFHANEAVSAAGLTPPSPFHGTGHYRAGPDGASSWTGSLSVDFPGARRFPLTGPSFKAYLEVPF
jgi:hypothetical protein